MGLSVCATVTDESGQELLEHGNTWYPIACYCDHIHTSPVPWHWHEELEAGVVEEGTAVLAVGKERYRIHEGSGFFINGGVLHAAWADGASPCILHSMCFHPRLVGNSDTVYWSKYLRPILDNRNLSCICLNPGTKWEQDAIVYLETAWRNHVEEPDGFEIEVRYALSKLLFLLNEKYALPDSVCSPKSIRNEERLKNMLQFIAENYWREIRLRDIADSAAVSESECLRCFRSTIKTTPVQYVKQFRLQKAAGLLKNAELSVSEAAGQCGFYDMSYFSGEFRKIYGCSPSEYRKLL